MINTALKEMRYAFKVFGPYEHIRKVAVFGSARTPKNDPDYKLACTFAKEMVKAGWMVITGASSGIMNAGNEGAGRANSFGVNIRLPFEQDANPVIKDDEKLIHFKYFFTRKLMFVRESHATVLLPGGFGTHDEGFETLTLVQTGKATPRPIVCLDPPGSNYWKSWKYFLEKELVEKKMIDSNDMHLIHFTHDPVEAAHAVARFYHNYHSMRYIGDHLVLRLKEPLSEAKLASLNQKFADILKKGKIEQQNTPFPEERDDVHTLDLVRLSLHHRRRKFARLKMLIDEINKGE